MRFEDVRPGEGGKAEYKLMSMRARAGRWRWHIAAPLIVSGAIAGLVLATAGETLRPAREIVVRPVVFAAASSAGESLRRPVNAPSEGAAGGAAAHRNSADGDERRRTAESGRHLRGGGGSVQAPGWLEAEPFSRACSALTDGVIEDVLVLAGDRVEAGDVVARLVSEDAELALRGATAELAQANAELGAARADLTAAETVWENPVERERAVAATRAQLAETEAELARLPSLIAAEQSTLERLREEMARAEEAARRGAATSIEVIIQQKRSATQEAALAALKGRERVLSAQRDRLRAEAAAAERNADLRIEERAALARAKAALAGAKARVERREASRDEARLRLERMDVRSPISGNVRRRVRAPGDKVILGSENVHSAHVAYVYDPSALQVRVDVPLADVAKVHVGQACEVIVEALPDEKFRGEVTRITHEADLQKNTLEIKVRVKNPSPVLKPEMLTRVKFLSAPPERTNDDAMSESGAGASQDEFGASGSLVRVPVACLERAGEDGSAARVWKIRERRGRRGRAHPVAVDIASVDDEWATVRGGLRPGDLVAESPQGLSAGAAVRMRGGANDKGGA